MSAFPCLLEFEFLVEIGCGADRDKCFVFPLDFACRDEPPLSPHLSDRVLPAQFSLMNISNSESRRLDCGQTWIG